MSTLKMPGSSGSLASCCWRTMLMKGILLTRLVVDMTAVMMGSCTLYCCTAWRRLCTNVLKFRWYAVAVLSWYASLSPCRAWGKGMAVL